VTLAALIAACATLLQEADASALFAAGKDAEALAACDARLAAGAGDAATIELRARCLQALGRFGEAAAALRALPSRSMAADLALAACSAAGDDAGAAEADAILARWGTADPDGFELRLARARVHLARRRVAPALADARFVLSRDPRRFEAQLLLARATEAGGRPDEAQRLAARLLDPAGAFRGADVHLRREAAAASASALIRMQRYDDAISLLRDLVAECPAVVPWRAQLATVLGLRNRYAESMENWEKAVEAAPEDGEMRWRLADVYRSQGRTDDAIAQFRVMLELGHSPAVAELRLAELHLERGDDGDFERARDHAERALALSPESGDVLAARGRVQEKLGEVAAAKESYRAAFARNPLRFDALYRLALLLARSSGEEERAEAEALFERYRRVEPLLVELKLTKQEADANPGQPALLTRMAGMLNLAGEYEHARVWAERADRLDPNSLQNAVQSGYILANLDDLPGAKRSFEKALALLARAPSSEAAIATLREYVRKIDRGEPLPRPLGRMLRPGEVEEGAK